MTRLLLYVLIFWWKTWWIWNYITFLRNRGHFVTKILKQSTFFHYGTLNNRGIDCEFKKVEINADYGVFNKRISNHEFQKWELTQIMWSVIRDVISVKSTLSEWIFKMNRVDVILRTSLFIFCGASRWHFKILNGLTI